MVRCIPYRALMYRVVFQSLGVILLGFACALLSTSAFALEKRGVSTGLSQALAVHEFKPLFPQSSKTGFSLGSSFFSGRGSGADPENERRVSGLGVLGAGGDRFAELEGDARVYALLIDGKYDFAYDMGGLAVHPYIGGGLGIALYDGGPSSAASLNQNRAMVPLFRLGGGVVFKMGADWDLSLNYKAGYTGELSGSTVFTGRSQEKVNLQALDMGIKFRF